MDGRLKYCPFCGGESKMTLRGNNTTKKRSAEVRCIRCGTKQVTGAIRNDLKWCEIQAIEKWNERITE